jgi:hypothetical protein
MRDTSSNRNFGRRSRPYNWLGLRSNSVVHPAVTRTARMRGKLARGKIVGSKPYLFMLAASSECIKKHSFSASPFSSFIEHEQKRLYHHDDPSILFVSRTRQHLQNLMYSTRRSLHGELSQSPSGLGRDESRLPPELHRLLCWGPQEREFHQDQSTCDGASSDGRRLDHYGIGELCRNA